jgi:hypothetical protein
MAAAYYGTNILKMNREGGRKAGAVLYVPQ